MAKKIGSIKSPNQDKAYNKVVEWFFSFPNREFSLNELSIALKIAKTTAKRVVNRLIDEGFLTRTIYGKVWIIKCNPQSDFNYTRKIAFNLGMVYEAYLGGIREDILEIVPNPRAIILFGSYRKGDDTEDSDIDIAVEVLDPKKAGIIELGHIAGFGYRKDVTVSLHIFTRKDVDVNLFSNIANGIVLSGFLEARP